MISGGRSPSRRSLSGIIPVAVAPRGRSWFSAIPYGRRSSVMIRLRASAPARAGPYGTNPRRCIVSTLIVTLTIRP